MNVKDKIFEILKQQLSPQVLEIEDDSGLHAGHPEAAVSGGGHFSVLIVSERFQGLKSVERHRLIYQALGNEFKKDIHALAVKALTPAEYQVRNL